MERVEPEGDARVERWSSTYVRERVAHGDMTAAAEALGRPFRVVGVVVRGHERGRPLGFPTANVPAPPGEVVPADGVYAGWLARLDEPHATRWPAAISVGTNPTFDGVERTVEAYVLDRDDLELYGVPVAIDFVDRIRGQERFDDGRGAHRADARRRRHGPATAHRLRARPSITPGEPPADMLSTPSERPRIESAPEDLPGSAAQ